MGGFGRVLGIFFFAAVLFAGLTSIINLYETPVAFLQEKTKLGRIPAVLIMHGLGLAAAVLIQAWAASGWTWSASTSAPSALCSPGSCSSTSWEADRPRRRQPRREEPRRRRFMPFGRYVYVPLCVDCARRGSYIGRNRLIGRASAAPKGAALFFIRRRRFSSAIRLRTPSSWLRMSSQLVSEPSSNTQRRRMRLERSSPGSTRIPSTSSARRAPREVISGSPYQAAYSSPPPGRVSSSSSAAARHSPPDFTAAQNAPTKSMPAQSGPVSTSRPSML